MMELTPEELAPCKELDDLTIVTIPEENQVPGNSQENLLHNNWDQNNNRVSPKILKHINEYTQITILNTSNYTIIYGIKLELMKIVKNCV